ncbi:hypothetical protein BHE74_00007572 [Ensete ventricosum]|uniref:Uncharacterized protein n=1 Tax=Ensete ventricosum TaxID=4639 RepID=A0A444GHC2_ENSVE|nr:hypothetical protein GW17_00000963 [Ensete ventricosum]RWW83897.1 hypothetical protein BHE74_00007572 [Ensete ventricosum]RZR71994.1 hypothetical protein BHM03_00009306 [Ensete ventricosum]
MRYIYYIVILLLSCLRLDHILLETTGLADPAPLASVLWLDDQLESAITLDSIITVSLLISYNQLLFSLENETRVRSWLEDLLWEKKSNMDVYRCKGVLNVLNSDQLHTLQVSSNT